MKTNTTGANNKVEQICPYLGIPDDSETALSYPSIWNCCFHAKPVVSPKMEHQRNYCLTSNHTTCTVFLKKEVRPLPVELRSGHDGSVKRNKPIWIVIPALLIILAVLLLVATQVFNKEWINFPRLSLPFVTPTQTVTVQTELPTVSPTKTTIIPTALPMSPTVLPSLSTTTVEITPTSASMHQLETPIGVEYKFVIHLVRKGESFPMLAGTYNTTIDAIRAVNFDMPHSLWADSILIIPVGMSSVEGLPAFSAYMVDEKGLTIEDLARKLSVDPTLLKQYNALPDGYLLSSGEWLLIPHLNSTP